MKSTTITRGDAGGRAVPERRYLNEQQLAAYASLSPRTLQNWRFFNQGPPWKRLGRAIQYPIDLFELWAATQPGGGGASESLEAA